MLGKVMPHWKIKTENRKLQNQKPEKEASKPETGKHVT